MTYYHYPDRRWALGHNVLAANMVNVQEQLYATSKPYLLPPSSQAINLYPVETALLSGKVRGDGMMNNQWEWGFMPIPTFQALMVWLFPNNEKSVPVTLYDRMHELSDEYHRFNCWVIRPVIGQDYKIDGGRVTELKLRFSGMRSLGDATIYIIPMASTAVIYPPAVYTGALTATVFANSQTFHNAGIGSPVEPQKFASVNVVRSPVVYNDRLTPTMLPMNNSFGAHSVAQAVQATVFASSNSFGAATVSQ